MKRKIYLLLLFFILCVFSQEALALGSGMGSGPPSPPCGQAPFPPCPIPLDGGIAILAGAGVLFGGKKIMESFRKN